MQKSFVSQVAIYLLIIFSGVIASGAEVQCQKISFLDSTPSRAIKKNSFVTSRTLLEYFGILHKDFKNDLLSLKQNEVWVDLGAGKGNAAVDFLKSFDALERAPMVTLIAYKIDRWFGLPNFNGKLTSLEGRMYEEIPNSDLPKAKLMTDVFGVLSYTKNLSQSLNKIFNQLEVGGVLYIESSHLHTSIKSGSDTVSLHSFLVTIPGLEVEGRFGRLKVTKVQEQVEVPEVRLLRINEEEFPPARSFEVLL